MTLIVNDTLVYFDTKLSVKPRPTLNRTKGAGVTGDKALVDAYANCLHGWFGNGTHMAAYENHWKEKNRSDQIEWEDLRIRKYTKDETTTNHNYLKRCCWTNEWEVRTSVL